MRYALPLLTLLFLTSCSGFSATGGPGALVKKPLSTEVEEDFNALRCNSLAVMPLEEGVGVRLSKAVSGKLDTALIDAFELDTSVEILNKESPQAVSLSVEKKWKESGAPLSRALAVGQELEAQGVLFGVINKYVERSGSAYGASRSSELGFRLWLLDVEKRKVVWTATYRNAEQPLSENLFRVGEALQEGLKFHTTAELAASGFSSAASAFEKLRSGQETEQ